LFGFFVAAIFAAYRAARKLALTFNSNLNHRVAQTCAHRRPPIGSKNISGAEGSVIHSSNKYFTKTVGGFCGRITTCNKNVRSAHDTVNFAAGVTRPTKKKSASALFFCDTKIIILLW
jgi:hypothetical protein